MFLLRKICQETGFLRFVFYRIRKESSILSSYGKILVRENSSCGIFYALIFELTVIDENFVLLLYIRTFMFREIKLWEIFFVVYLVQSPILQIVQLTVANLVRLGISVCCQVSFRFQYLVRFHSLRCITGGHRIYLFNERILSPTGVKLTTF